MLLLGWMVDVWWIMLSTLRSCFEGIIDTRRSRWKPDASNCGTRRVLMLMCIGHTFPCEAAIELRSRLWPTPAMKLSLNQAEMTLLCWSVTCHIVSHDTQTLCWNRHSTGNQLGLWLREGVKPHGSDTCKCCSLEPSKSNYQRSLTSSSVFKLSLILVSNPLLPSLPLTFEVELLHC